MLVLVQMLLREGENWLCYCFYVDLFHLAPQASKVRNVDNTSALKNLRSSG